MTAEPKPTADETKAADVADANSEELVEADAGDELLEDAAHPAVAALAEAEARVAQYHEEMLRIRAEAENARKRAARDADNARKFALERIMGDLLDVKDNLERGLEASADESATIEQLREGKELTLRTLTKALEKHGLVEVDPVGEAFNPEHHEALSMVPTADQAPNTVVTVIQKGYLLNGRLLRPARVMVAKES